MDELTQEIMNRLREQNRKLTIENSELRDKLWETERKLRELEWKIPNHNCPDISIDLDSHDGTSGIFSHWLED